MGRTGQGSTRAIFGYALNSATQAEADRVLEAAARFRERPAEEEMAAPVAEHRMRAMVA